MPSRADDEGARNRSFGNTCLGNGGAHGDATCVVVCVLRRSVERFLASLGMTR